MTEKKDPYKDWKTVCTVRCVQHNQPCTYEPGHKQAIAVSCASRKLSVQSDRERRLRGT